MGKRVVDDESLSLVADKIRAYTGGEDGLMFPDDFSNGIDDVSSTAYVEGYEDGNADGYLIGYSEGKDEGQSEVDAILSNENIGDYYNDRITKLRTYAFYYCSTITTAEFPNVLECNTGSLRQCANLTEVRFASLQHVYVSGLMADCPKLEFVDLGPSSAVGTTTFTNDTSLKTIILRRGAAPAALQNLNTFNGTPYDSGGSGGKVYVPSALIEQYKNATNWSVLVGYGTVEFVAIEGSEYE